MHLNKRNIVAAVGCLLVTCAAIGCGKKDATETAAPPPSANAVAEPGVQKNLPTNAAPTGNGGASGTQQVFKN